MVLPIFPSFPVFSFIIDGWLLESTPCVPFVTRTRTPDFKKQWKVGEDDHKYLKQIATHRETGRLRCTVKGLRSWELPDSSADNSQNTTWPGNSVTLKVVVPLRLNRVAMTSRDTSRDLELSYIWSSQCLTPLSIPTYLCCTTTCCWWLINSAVMPTH